MVHDFFLTIIWEHWISLFSKQQECLQFDCLKPGTFCMGRVTQYNLNVHDHYDAT